MGHAEVETHHEPLSPTTASQPASFDILQELLVQKQGVAPEAIRPEATLKSLGIELANGHRASLRARDAVTAYVPDLRTPVTTLGDFAKLLDDLRAATTPPQTT